MSKLRPLLFAAVLVGTGCASYQPAEISTLKPQEKIRVELEPEELARLIGFADPRTRSVSGRFVDEIGDSVAIVVQTPSSYMQVSIPRGSIIQTERRVADNKKSFFVSAAIVGGVAAIAIAGFQGRGQGSIGDDTGIDETRIPLFGFGIPFSLGIGN